VRGAASCSLGATKIERVDDDRNKEDECKGSRRAEKLVMGCARVDLGGML
jgi:hypothetical protein